MAYTINGFTPSRQPSIDWVRNLPCQANTNGSNQTISKGDAVAYVNGVLVPASAGQDPTHAGFGVVLAVYTPSNIPLTFRRTKTLVSGQAGRADVCFDPNQTYYVRCSASCGLSDIGKNAVIVASAANTSIGLSGQYIDIPASASENDLFRVINIGPFEQVSTQSLIRGGTNNGVEVRWNRHMLNATSAPASAINTNPQNIYVIGDSITFATAESSKYVNGNITGLTSDNPGVFTKTSHGFATSDSIYTWGILQPTDFNETVYTANVIDANQYDLGVNTTGMDAYTSLGRSFATDNAIFYLSPRGYMSALNALTGQRYNFYLRNNRGVSGDTSTSIVTRLDVSLPVSANPDIVVLLIGTNDVNSSVPLATFQSNVNAIISHIHSLGAICVIGTVPPVDSNTSGQKDLKDTYNAWIRTLQSSNIYVWEVYDNVADGSRNWISGYSYDGTHPDSQGGWAMAQALSDVLTPLYGYYNYTQSAGNLVTNPTLSGTGGSATGITNNGIATGWTAGIGGTTGSSLRTVSKDANDVQVLQVDFTGSETNNETLYIERAVSAGVLSVGSWYVAEAQIGLFSVSGNGLWTEASLTLRSNSANLSLDQGRPGTPTTSLPTASMITACSARSLCLRSLPVKMLSGYTSLVPRIVTRYNAASNSISAQMKVYNVQLYETTDPYA